LQQYKESHASIYTGKKTVTDTSVETVAAAVHELLSGYSVEEVPDNDSIQQHAVIDQVQASSLILELQTIALRVTVNSSAKPIEESISVEVGEVDSTVMSEAQQSNKLIYSLLVETALESPSKTEVACEPVTTSLFCGHKQKANLMLTKVMLMLLHCVVALCRLGVI